MWLHILAVVAGFALLVWGADRFVTGAAATARNLGVSPLVIGLTIVGFGTSAPELLISAVASWEGNTGLAIGNAIGSNVANIALVLGATALIAPLDIQSETLRREFPVLLATMLVTLMLLSDGVLSRLDGILLLTGIIALLYGVVSLALRSRVSDPIGGEYAAEMPPTMSTLAALAWVVIGLAILLLSSKLLVWGAVNIAKQLGISDLIIGLSIVAIGTSLPELAASVMSAIKRESDIAIGNIIGSNMFNILAVLGMPGVIQPGDVPMDVLSRDFPVMIGLTLALFAMAYGFRGPGRINRMEGGILVTCFLAYQILIFYSQPG